MDFGSILSSSLKADTPIYFAFMTVHDYIISHILLFTLSFFALCEQHYRFATGPVEKHTP